MCFVSVCVCVYMYMNVSDRMYEFECVMYVHVV